MDEQLAALAAQVAELRTEVERLSQGRAHTMAQTFRCPSCGGARILHFRRVQEATHHQLVDLALQKEISAWTAAVKSTAGALEAYACRNCQLVEWHANDLASVVVDGVNVVEYDGSEQPAPPMPYR